VSLQEGGIRVPMIARWPGMIEPGTTCDHISAFQDWMPTLMEVTGGEVPADTDGLSLLPSLLGHSGRQQAHDYLYWEHNGQQAVRSGNWKAFRRRVPEPIELYDLEQDLAESTDVAADHPAEAAWIEQIMQEGRTRSELFPLIRD
jgi:arylsulfatase A